MKFFLDTASIEEITSGVQMGLVDGITTNPSLVAKENREFTSLIKEICSIVPGPVNAEVVSLKADEMIEEGKKLAAIAENIIVKIPMTKDGLVAVRKLADIGIKTNVTLIFSPLQALAAAKAGASYVSPFVGRLDDISHEGMDLVEKILTIYDNYGYDAEVIVASIRHPLHVVSAALMGGDIATMPYSVLLRMFEHPLTDIGLQKFLKDWEKVPK